MAMVDLIAIVPMFIEMITSELYGTSVLRIMRLIRIADWEDQTDSERVFSDFMMQSN